MVFCTYCGQQLRPRWTFCPRCGAQIEPPDFFQAPASQQMPPGPHSAPSHNESHVQENSDTGDLRRHFERTSVSHQSGSPSSHREASRGRRRDRSATPPPWPSPPPPPRVPSPVEVKKPQQQLPPLSSPDSSGIQLKDFPAYFGRKNVEKSAQGAMGNPNASASTTAELPRPPPSTQPLAQAGPPPLSAVRLKIGNLPPGPPVPKLGPQRPSAGAKPVSQPSAAPVDNAKFPPLPKANPPVVTTSVPPKLVPAVTMPKQVTQAEMSMPIMPNPPCSKAHPKVWPENWYVIRHHSIGFMRMKRFPGVTCKNCKTPNNAHPTRFCAQCKSLWEIWTFKTTPGTCANLECRSKNSHSTEACGYGEWRDHPDNKLPEELKAFALPMPLKNRMPLPIYYLTGVGKPPHPILPKLPVEISDGVEGTWDRQRGLHYSVVKAIAEETEVQIPKYDAKVFLSHETLGVFPGTTVSANAPRGRIIRPAESLPKPQSNISGQNKRTAHEEFLESPPSKRMKLASIESDHSLQAPSPKLYGADGW